MRHSAFLLFLLTSLLGGVSELRGQSYEGYLTSEKDQTRAPVWLDLRPGSGAGRAGAYFYKRVGTPLPLAGTSNGRALFLEERGANGRVTGKFSLTDFGDSLTGTWSAPSGGTRFRVWLVPVDSAYRRLARVPSADLVRLRDGRTLRAIHREASDGGANTTSSIRVTFHRRGVVVYAFDVSYVGAYVTDVTEAHVFDVQGNREIDLKAEVRPDQADAFWARIGAQLRKEVATWEREMAKLSEEERLDAETVQEVRTSVAEFAADADRYALAITDAGLEVTTSGEEFGVARALRALAFDFTMQIPYAELRPYLRAGSPLTRLVQP